MSNPLSRRVAGLFRSRSELTSLRRLAREGVRQVNVIDLRRIEEIVGEAIEKAVEEAAEGGASPRFAAEGAQVEFLRLLGLDGRIAAKHDELAAARDTLSSNLEQLRGELDSSKAQLAAKSEQSERAAVDALRGRIQSALREAFERSASSLASHPEAAAALSGLESPLRIVLLELLGEALHAGRAAGPALDDGTQVELLERRVKKLNAQLLETQELLERTRADQARDAEGIASIAAQPGTRKDDALSAQQRRELMREILQHNLELRRTLAEPGPSRPEAAGAAPAHEKDRNLP